MHTVTFKIISPVPSAPPKNIVIDNTTVFTITLNWKPVDCMYRNGKITKYIIQYHKQDRENETMNDTTAMLEFTITDLQPYTVYVIRVAAVNGAGIGVYGTLTADTGPCKLNSQRVYMCVICMCVVVEVTVKSKSSTKITLVWSEANYTAMKTVEISWAMENSSFCMYDEDVDGQTTYVITELKAHSSYTITVCVEDLVCESVTETTSESGTDKKHPNCARKNIFFL